MPRPCLVVFSHLRWDFVYQRPQHLMTRIAADRRVFYVEEPVLDEAKPRWETTSPAPGVTVCRPHTPVRSAGFNDDQNKVLGPMLEQLLRDHDVQEYDLWFYSPMALPLADAMTPGVVVYDNMDDLSAFKFAPAQSLEREEQLLQRADVVFAGGPSLYRAMRGRHPNVRCFASSVDAPHFGAAAGPLPEPAGQAGIPHPRLGFFGVVDERFDAALLAAAADARPGWHFVVVGPVVKIDPATLPRRPNIHYAGARGYDELPAFLSGWDVALLVFARNEATRKISPTKVLEYMAAGKPIVSTRITDIVDPYAAMVGLGDDPEEFVAACEDALGETPEARSRRLHLYAGVLASTSWDATARGMSELVAAARSRKLAPAGFDPGKTADAVVIVGAGPTGLSAAYHLGRGSILLEANAEVGGWCRSFVDNGFTFDCAGHIMFSADPYVHQMYQALLGGNVHWQDREAWIYSKQVYTRYPFQGSLHGLPADVVQECIVGAIEARFGSLDTKPVHGQTNGQAGDPKDAAVLGLRGHSEASPTLADRGGEPRNFEEFIYKVWGAGIAKHFAIPYNKKIWAVPLDEMETSWLGGRVPLPDLRQMIEGALSQSPKPMGPNARFGYPLRGGFQALMDGFLPLLEGDLRLNTRVEAISVLGRVVTLQDGTQLPYDQLISTMPLPSLIRAIGGEVPAEVAAAAAGLRYTSVRCVNLGVNRENLTEKHWIYYPEDTVFHRIFVQGNASPHCNPPGGFGLTCEITYGPLKPLPCDGQELIQRCVDDCVRVGFFDANDTILAANQVDMPFAYVVYDHARPRNVAIIREWLGRHDVHLAGRYGEWEYYNSDHAFLAGKKAAEAVRRRMAGDLAATVAV